jgi:hypothetical protein
MRAPSGENAVASTPSSWPRRTIGAAPLARSHTRIVPSVDPLTIRVPSGENAAASTSSPWPRRGADQGGAGGRGDGSARLAACLAHGPAGPGAGGQEVAQVAACIGREFAYPLLAAVSPFPEPELRAALDRLAAAELVFSRGVPPEASYTFKHALVRDAAHESLLKAQRQQLHGLIVRVLEERFPETVETEPELLAQHCTEAGLSEQAVDCWQRAGQQALARSATAEAVAQLGRGLELLAGLSDGPERRRRELGLQLALGPALIAAKGFAAPETGRAYARACELCRQLDDTRKLS